MPKIYKEERALAHRLRNEGKSYREIQRLTGVPSRGTLSSWFKDFQPSPEAREILRRKKERTAKNVDKFNKERTARIAEENEATIEKSASSIGKISERDLLLLGCALYWGEGTLRIKQHGTMNCSEFANSSPEIIKVFMLFTRKILKIKERDIRGYIYTYPKLNPEVAIKFWSRMSDIAPAMLRAYNLVSRASKGKRPTNFLPYGTLKIRISGRQNFYKIRGYINGITKSLI